MARKRMFRTDVLDTDAFLDMPLSAQALYFHLNLRADDDGFIGNPKRITSTIGASIDDLRLLVAKRFVIAFEDGVIVIKHWRMHNTIQKDRYVSTVYTQELAMLGIKENKAYTLNVSKVETNCFQNVSTDIDIDIDKGLGKDLGIDIDKDKDKDLDLCYTPQSPLTDLETNLCQRIIGYLNGKTGRRFNYNTNATRKAVNARIGDGYTEDDFYKVIDNKCHEWLGTEQEQFLRPSTLFAPSHFDEYLNQGLVKKRKAKTNDERSEQMQADIDRWAESG